MRAVVLTAAGPVFSAGADFADLTGTGADVEYDAVLHATCRTILETPVPVVVAIRGACVGAAVELALSCDVRVAGPNASFRVPAVELGLLYSPESIRRLHAVLPRTTLTRLLLLAERYDGQAALAAGLATHDVAGDARDEAFRIAGRIAMQSSEATNATCALLRELDEGRWSADHWQERRLELLSSPARAEAVAAAKQRHTPSTPSLSTRQ